MTREDSALLPGSERRASRTKHGWTAAAFERHTLSWLQEAFIQEDCSDIAERLNKRVRALDSRWSDPYVYRIHTGPIEEPQSVDGLMARWYVFPCVEQEGRQPILPAIFHVLLFVLMMAGVGNVLCFDNPFADKPHSARSSDPDDSNCLMLVLGGSVLCYMLYMGAMVFARMHVARCYLASAKRTPGEVDDYMKDLMAKLATAEGVDARVETRLRRFIADDQYSVYAVNPPCAEQGLQKSTLGSVISRGCGGGGGAP